MYINVININLAFSSQGCERVLIVDDRDGERDWMSMSERELCEDGRKKGRK